MGTDSVIFRASNGVPKPDTAPIVLSIGSTADTTSSVLSKGKSYEFTPDVRCRIRFGASDDVAALSTDTPAEANLPMIRTMPEDLYFSVIYDGTDEGTMVITELDGLFVDD